MKLPIEFEKRMRVQLGDEYEAFAKAFCEGSEAKGLRFSLCRLPADGPEKDGVPTESKIPWANAGYYVDEKTRPGKNIYHEAGAYYLQEPSAMVVATLADVKPGAIFFGAFFFSISRCALIRRSVFSLSFISSEYFSYNRRNTV